MARDMEVRIDGVQMDAVKVADLSTTLVACTHAKYGDVLHFSGVTLGVKLAQVDTTTREELKAFVLGLAAAYGWTKAEVTVSVFNRFGRQLA